MGGDRIFLWTNPRSVSTAFERAFLQREDVEVEHEPFTGPYYFGPERTSDRYLSSDPEPHQTYGVVAAGLLRPLGQGKRLFIKDMAYALDRDRLPPGFLSRFQHTFLIRHPRLAVQSLYRMSVNTAQTGWDHFDPDEAGYTQLDALVRWVTEDLGQPVTVVDASTLVARPEATLRAYCAAVGLPFDQRMLSWEPGPISSFDTWAGWHDEVLRSTGFSPGIAGRDADGDDETALPDIVLRTIDKAMPIYDRLRAMR